MLAVLLENKPDLLAEIPKKDLLLPFGLV